MLEPVACWEFDGDILVLHHPTTISTKYQAMGKYSTYIQLCDMSPNRGLILYIRYVTCRQAMG